MESVHDGGGLAKGSTVTLHVGGEKVGDGRVERSLPFAFSADESMDVGLDAGMPVSPDYGPRSNAIPGEVQWVQLDVDEAALDQDHLLQAEERLKPAMAPQ